MKYLLALLFLAAYINMQAQEKPYIQILGIMQDGGYPHMGCSRDCCKQAWKDPKLKKHVVCLALADPVSKKWWLFEATPDIKDQLYYFRQQTKGLYNYLPDGIFITHAHIGHYTGLMQLGREVMNTTNVPVYVLPKMKTYLESNGPWSQLVKLQNITIHEMQPNSPVPLPDGISIEAFLVPHRDEYSETAGFKIITPDKKYLFIPDINKWQKWDHDIVSQVQSVDIAMVDATFYDSSELSNKRMNEVSHPLVSETMQVFQAADEATRAKLYLIHFNHTNPLLNEKAHQMRVKKAGFKLASEGQIL